MGSGFPFAGLLKIRPTEKGHQVRAMINFLVEGLRLERSGSCHEVRRVFIVRPWGQTDVKGARAMARLNAREHKRSQVYHW